MLKDLETVVEKGQFSDAFSIFIHLETPPPSHLSRTLLDTLQKEYLKVSSYPHCYHKLEEKLMHTSFQRGMGKEQDSNA